MSEMHQQLHERICDLIFNISVLNEIVTDNRNRLPDFFVDDFFDWHGVVIDYLRDQRDNLQRLKLLF